MITVTVEVSEGFVRRRISCTTASIERAVELARGSRPVAAEVIFPIDPERFFADAAEYEIADEDTPLESRPKEGARS